MANYGGNEHLMMQAPIDDNFESKYWKCNPDDNYSRGICMWNERCIHLLQKSVFLYSCCCCTQSTGLGESRGSAPGGWIRQVAFQDFQGLIKLMARSGVCRLTGRCRP